MSIEVGQSYKDVDFLTNFYKIVSVFDVHGIGYLVYVEYFSGQSRAPELVSVERFENMIKFRKLELVNA
jgi:hypothetical protein